MPDKFSYENENKNQKQKIAKSSEKNHIEKWREKGRRKIKRRMPKVAKFA